MSEHPHRALGPDRLLQPCGKGEVEKGRRGESIARSRSRLTEGSSIGPEPSTREPPSGPRVADIDYLSACRNAVSRPPSGEAGRIMLKNDEIFWAPTETSNAARKSWGGSGGDPARLWELWVTRWQVILRRLARAGVRPPAGRIVEFGAGLGLLDDLLDASCSSILMLDHTDAYIRERSTPLSARCRHVLWSQEALDALQAEPAAYDWVISLAVFWHVDDATAAALVRELGKLLKPGGHVLIHGWNLATAEKGWEMSSRHRLFDRYPTYVLNPDLLRKTLAPAYHEVCRDTILLYRKDRAQEVGPRPSLRTIAARFLRTATLTPGKPSPGARSFSGSPGTRVSHPGHAYSPALPWSRRASGTSRPLLVKHAGALLPFSPRSDRSRWQARAGRARHTHTGS